MIYLTNNRPHKDKFEPRASRGVFIGYSPGQKGYKLYNLDSKQVEVSRDVKFCESIFPFLNSNTATTDNSTVDIVLPMVLKDDSPLRLSLNTPHQSHSSLDLGLASSVSVTLPSATHISESAFHNPTLTASDDTINSEAEHISPHIKVYDDEPPR